MTTALPLPVRIVALLFLVGGISSAIGSVVKYFQGHFAIDLAILGLCIGPGLISGNRTWHKWALALTWIEVVLIPPVTVIILSGAGPPLFFSILGITVEPISRPVFVGIALFGEGLSIWTLWVLNRYVAFMRGELTVTRPDIQ